jgi:hypothetical protein
MFDLADEDSPTLVRDRSCGSCSLCCKLLPINDEELKKPPSVWCKNCAPGKGGCTIYENRPLSCRRFVCLWLITEGLEDHWKPLTSKMVAFVAGDKTQEKGNRVAIYVDPSSPTKWREEPYYGQIRAWSESALKVQAHVVVYVHNRAIVVLPNKEVDIGRLRPNDRITVKEKHVSFGRDWDVHVTTD